MSKQSMITTKKEKQEKKYFVKMLRSLFLEEYNNYCFTLDMLKIARNRLYDRFGKEYKIQVYDERYFLGIKLISSGYSELNDPLGGLGSNY